MKDRAQISELRENVMALLKQSGISNDVEQWALGALFALNWTLGVNK